MSEQAQTPSIRNPRALVVVAVLTVFGLGLLGDFVWDDHELIASNAYLRDLKHLPRVLLSDFWHISAASETGDSLQATYWRPVVTLAYVLQYQLFGARPFGYHLVNLVLHLTCSLLAWEFAARRLSTPVDASARTTAATIAAVLFAVHPSRPETVSWISGSTDLWMTLWTLLAARTLDRGGRFVGLRAGLFVALGILSKEAAIVVPALFVTDAHLRGDEAPKRRAAYETVIVGAVTLAVRLAVMPPKQLRGAASSLVDVGLRALSSLGHYAAGVVWPWSPTAQTAYRAWSATGRAVYEPWSLVLGAVVITTTACVAMLAWRRPAWRPVAADTLWVLAPLVLVLNLIDLQLDVLVALRFLYLPMVGVGALLARAVVATWHVPRRNAALGVAGAVLVAMAVTSLRHAEHFRSDEDLWTHEVATNRRNPFAHGELARVRHEQGRVGEAIDLYARGVAAAREIHHRFHENQLVMKFATLAMLATPDYDQATLTRVRHFFDAVAAGAPAPIALDVPGARVVLRWNDSERAARDRVFQYRVARAIAHARTLSFVEAQRQLVAVLRATPDAWLAWQNLAFVYAATDRWNDAVHAIAEATRHNPERPMARALLAMLTEARARIQAAPDHSPERETAACTALVDLHVYEAARRRLDHALTTWPTHPALRALRARIESEERGVRTQ